MRPRTVIATAFWIGVSRPARVTEEVAEAAEAIACRAAAALELVGVLAVEMFVDRDGQLRANEIAPRPHNSGHWTIEACRESQFAMHVRTVCGLPLPDPGRHADAVMRNLIGPEGMAQWDALLGPGRRGGAPLRQDGSPRGPEDGTRDLAVPARSAPGRSGRGGGDRRDLSGLQVRPDHGGDRVGMFLVGEQGTGDARHHDAAGRGERLHLRGRARWRRVGRSIRIGGRFLSANKARKASRDDAGSTPPVMKAAVPKRPPGWRRRAAWR